MSIISDALKKAQKQKSQNEQKENRQTARGKNNQIPKIKLLGFLLIVLIFVVITSVFSRRNQRKTAPAITPPQPVEMQPSTQPLYHEQTREELPTTEPKFELSGIIFDAVSPMAVINNRILGVGETVGEAKLLKIEPNKVKLDYKGKELVLYLR